MHPKSLLLALPLIGLPFLARAQESYQLEGDHTRRGPYRGSVRLETLPSGRVAVVHSLTFRDGSSTRRSSLYGAREGQGVVVLLHPTPSAAGALGRHQARPLELRLTFGLGGRSLRTEGLVDDQVVLRGRGHRGDSLRPISPPRPTPASQPPAREARPRPAPLSPGPAATPDSEPRTQANPLARLFQGPGVLLDLLPREIRQRVANASQRAFADGLRKDYSLNLGRYGHLGAAAGLEVVKELTPTQAMSLDRVGAQQGAWLRARVEGGAASALSAEIPLAETGLTFGVGFDAGARLRYEVTRLYPFPTGVSDVRGLTQAAAALPYRTFALPLSAEGAARMQPGAVVSIAGSGRAALNGTLTLARPLEVVTSEVARVGLLPPRLSGFYRVSGELSIRVERLLGDQVRVHLTRGSRREFGASAEAILGVALDRAALADRVEQAVDYVDRALIDTGRLPAELRQHVLDEARRRGAGALDHVEEAIEIKLEAKATFARRKGLDVVYRFDLADAEQRQAYQRAVRGDFTRPAGAVLERRDFEAERSFHIDANYAISYLLRGGLSKTVSARTLERAGPQGDVRQEVWTYSRDRRRDFASRLFKVKTRRRNSFDLTITRNTDRDGGRVGRSLHLVWEQTDPITLVEEARAKDNLLRVWGMGAQRGLPSARTRYLIPEYGATHSRVELEIDEVGLRKILGSSSRDRQAAYARAFRELHEQEPLFATPAGRGKLNSSERSRYSLHREADWDMATFDREIGRLARAKTFKKRAKHLRRLANRLRSYLAVRALTILAGQEHCSIEAELSGKHLLARAGSHRGARFSALPAAPR